MTEPQLCEVMAQFTLASREWQSPAVTIVSHREGSPFKVLVSCILSLRTNDRTTGPASERLFLLASHAAALAELSPGQIEEAIYAA